MPAVAWVEPHHPPCFDHEAGWTGIGFPRHPSVMVYLCVRCWNVLKVIVDE